MADKYTQGVMGGTGKTLDKYKKYMKKREKGDLPKEEYSKNKIVGAVRKKQKQKKYKKKVQKQLYGAND